MSVSITHKRNTGKHEINTDNTVKLCSVKAQLGLLKREITQNYHTYNQDEMRTFFVKIRDLRRLAVKE